MTLDGRQGTVSVLGADWVQSSDLYYSDVPDYSKRDIPVFTFQLQACLVLSFPRGSNLRLTIFLSC